MIRYGQIYIDLSFIMIYQIISDRMVNMVDSKIGRDVRGKQNGKEEYEESEKDTRTAKSHPLLPSLSFSKSA